MRLLPLYYPVYDKCQQYLNLLFRQYLYIVRQLMEHIHFLQTILKWYLKNKKKLLKKSSKCLLRDKILPVDNVLMRHQLMHHLATRDNLNSVNLAVLEFYEIVEPLILSMYEILANQFLCPMNDDDLSMDAIR